MPDVQVALIVGITSSIGVISPIILAVLTNKQRRREKQEDYVRQDLVASRVEQNNREMREDQKKSNYKLDQIHDLVNSQFTAALQAELAARSHSLELMKSFLRTSDPQDPQQSEFSLEEIRSSEKKIEELKYMIKERLDLAAKVAGHGRMASSMDYSLD